MKDRHIHAHVLRYIASFLHSSPFRFKARFSPGSVAATAAGLVLRTTVDVVVACIPERTDLVAQLFDEISDSSVAGVVGCLVEGQCPNFPSADECGLRPCVRLSIAKM